MAKKGLLLAMGGHISTQNASFRKLIEVLPDWEWYGGEDGFKCFDTGNVYPLTLSNIPRLFPGFYAGASRYSLLDKETKEPIPEKIEKARDFFKRGGFDIVVGSVGDDHGVQMDILAETLKGSAEVYGLNKTMDNDVGGEDGKDEAPYTDFTNGYITAVETAVEMIHHHFSGAWTNNLPYLISPFGRETNWVGIALAYWGLADRIIYGELPKDHPGHSIDKVVELIRESQETNAEKYGRKFAMIIVPEGTRITGIQHISEDLIDAHGNHKLQPEVLVAHLGKELQLRYGIKTQTVGITYEMRNFPGTIEDIELAEASAVVIADAIKKGNHGSEAVFKIVDDGRVEPGIAPISKVSKKRYARYYREPLINPDTFTVTDAIGRYYRPLFGDRRSLEEILPQKPQVINVYR